MSIVEWISDFFAASERKKNSAEFNNGWRDGARELGYNNKHKKGSREFIDYERGYQTGAADRNQWPG